MIKYYLLFILTLLVTPLVAQDTDNTVWLLTPQDIRRNYDGDTFMVNLKGLPAVFGYDLSIRIADMDAPELRSRCNSDELRAKERGYAAEARDFLVKLLQGAKQIRVYDLRRDSFFRIIANVDVDGVPIQTLMIKAGYAQPVQNSKMLGWCNDQRVLNFKL